jgi:hypothetical protein
MESNHKSWTTVLVCIRQLLRRCHAGAAVHDGVRGEEERKTEAGLLPFLRSPECDPTTF